MISAQVKKQRLVNGAVALLMVVGGVAMAALGGKNMLDGFEVELSEPAMKEQLLSHCEQTLRDNRYRVVRNGTRIDAQHWGLENPLKTAADASAAMLRCPGLELERFCMGSGCDEAEISFTLKVRD